MFEVEGAAERNWHVVEVHPEVPFRALAGEELLSKRTPEGAEQCWRLLESQGIELPETGLRLCHVLDAVVAAWDRVPGRSRKGAHAARPTRLPANPASGGD